MNEFSSVTVIIPAYNVETCLARAITSALGQKPQPLEVIVINDGSSDKTTEVAKSFGARIRYLEQSNLGPAAARNAGLAVAKGDYVAFLDADDYWLSGFISATARFLHANPDAVAVSTGWQIHPLKGDVKNFPTKEAQSDVSQQEGIVANFLEFWAKHDHVRTGTVMINRSKIGQNVFQRADLRLCEDLEFWGYLSTLGSWGFIPKSYWFGDSARIGAKTGWLKRYRLRRNQCLTVEMWQERILSKLQDSDWPYFRKIRGRVAQIYAHNMILAGRFQDARKIVATYKNELPNVWSARMLSVGHEWGFIAWQIVCFLLWLREQQKNITLAHKHV